MPRCFLAVLIALSTLQWSLRSARTSGRGSQDGTLWDAVLYGLNQLDGFDQIN